ncbi:MAG: hypothetical protein JNL80_18025 [Phycisphaerae bacterium]|jgi:hypothetical protein|nr:hypothetical protein [Phycisphaerae bacterium]
MTRSSTIVLSVAATFSIAATLSADQRAKPRKEQGGIAGVSCSCDGDYNNSGGIEAGDLAFLLGAWGGAGGDLDGNGTTDAADLAILLGSWGPCGAPVNDECASAIAVANGDAIPFCNVNATWSGQSFGAGACEGSSTTTITNDLWYEYVADGDGTLTLSTCGTADFDTIIAAYASILPIGSACPPVSGVSLVSLVGCSDDSDSCGATSVQSKLSIDVLAGKTYMIRLGGWNGHTGSGTLNLTFKSIGSQCFDGILIEGADGVTQTVTGTTVDNFTTFPPCTDQGSRGEWITYIPTCQEEHVFLSTCNDGTNFDTVLAVWKETLAAGCDGDLKACEDDTQSASCTLNGNFRKTKVDFYASAGSIYHILVAGFNQSTAGNYQLTIETDCVTP